MLTRVNALLTILRMFRCSLMDQISPDSPEIFVLRPNYLPLKSELGLVLLKKFFLPEHSKNVFYKERQRENMPKRSKLKFVSF